MSRSYGSILPTSLTYIVLSTRGCSPWRPAAVMSTTWRKSDSFRWIFTGRQERTGRGGGAALCRPWNPSSGQTDFRVGDRQEEKRTLPGAPADVSTFSCVAAKKLHPGAGILTGFPFARRRTRARLQSELPYGLGSTHSCPTAVHKKPFPTSVLKVPI